MEVEDNIIKIGWTKDWASAYLSTKQRASLVPLKCVGIISKIGDDEVTMREESLVHRLLRNYSHHGKEVFRYTEESKKIIDCYLKEYMTEKDYKIVDDINESMKAVWNKKRDDMSKQVYVDGEPMFECRHCHELFKAEEIGKYREHGAGYYCKNTLEKKEKRHPTKKKKDMCRYCGRMLYEKGLRWHDKHCSERYTMHSEDNEAFVEVNPNLIDCEYCNKYFLTDASLRSHLKFCKGNPNRVIEEHKCEVCGKICSSKGGLTSHMRVHKS